MNIAVLFGGISTERNVSITGGRAVIEALRSKGHNVLPVDPAFGAEIHLAEDVIANPANYPSFDELKQYETKKIIECINSDAFNDIDVAFIVLHGKYGEDGRIQSLLEIRGVPYTGSGVKASAMGMDKNASKMLFLAAGIPTPPWVLVRPQDYDNYEFFKEIRSELGDELVVKPNNQGSSIGVTIIEDGNLDEIFNAVRLASEYSKNVLVEKFIDGREITVGIIGEEALPIIEIIPEEGFYDYKHKYSKGHTVYECPAEISEDISDFAQSLAVSSYISLGCSGFARADFRLNDEGQPFLMEINTIPGFTTTSLVPMAAKEVGIDFPDLCEKIIQLALE